MLTAGQNHVRPAAEIMLLLMKNVALAWQPLASIGEMRRRESRRPKRRGDVEGAHQSRGEPGVAPSSQRISMYVRKLRLQ